MFNKLGITVGSSSVKVSIVGDILLVDRALGGIVGILVGSEVKYTGLVTVGISEVSLIGTLCGRVEAIVGWNVSTDKLGSIDGISVAEIPLVGNIVLTIIVGGNVSGMSKLGELVA